MLSTHSLKSEKREEKEKGKRNKKYRHCENIFKKTGWLSQEIEIKLFNARFYRCQKLESVSTKSLDRNKI